MNKAVRPLAAMALLSTLLNFAPLLAGCARQHDTSAPDVASFAPDLVLRHRVRVESPRFNLPPFDGLAAFGTTDQGRYIHVLGHGGLGLTLFDLLVGRESVLRLRLHPSLEKIPDIEQEIASCLRAIWPDLQPSHLDEHDRRPDTQAERLAFENKKRAYAVYIRLVESLAPSTNGHAQANALKNKE